jgi:hypothetical protein
MDLKIRLNTMNSVSWNKFSLNAWKEKSICTTQVVVYDLALSFKKDMYFWSIQ